MGEFRGWVEKELETVTQRVVEGVLGDTGLRKRRRAKAGWSGLCTTSNFMSAALRQSAWSWSQHVLDLGVHLPDASLGLREYGFRTWKGWKLNGKEGAGVDHRLGK